MLDIEFLTHVESGQIFIAQVGSIIFGLGFRNFPLKIPNFLIFSHQIKKITSGQV